MQLEQRHTRRVWFVSRQYLPSLPGGSFRPAARDRLKQNALVVEQSASRGYFIVEGHDPGGAERVTHIP